MKSGVGLSLKQAIGMRDEGRIREAELHCRAILKKKPRSLGAMQLLAEILGGLQRFSEAEEIAKKCVEIRPSDPVCHISRGRVFQEQMELEEAIECYDRALSLQGDHSVAIAAKASALEMLGRREEAWALMLPALESGAETSHVAVYASLVASKLGYSEEALSIIQRHVDHAQVNHQWHLLFILGQIHEKAGRFEKAFQAFHEANELRPGIFSSYEYRQRIDEMIRTFSKERLPRLARATNSSETPVFVVGLPRSGTSLVEKIISMHSGAYGAGELLDVLQMSVRLNVTLESDLTYPECIRHLHETTADELAEQYLSRTAEISGGADRVVDKMPHNFEHLGLISRLFPKARVVHCRRDSVDTCFSIFTQMLNPQTHGYSTSLENIGVFCREYKRLMDHWREVLDIQMIEVDYEKLVENQEVESRRLIEFCGLEWDDHCLRFYESQQTTYTLSYDQVRQPMYKSSIGRGQKFEKHLGPLIEALKGSASR